VVEARRGAVGGCRQREQEPGRPGVGGRPWVFG